MPETNLPQGITRFDANNWENAHRNFTHNFTPGASYSVSVPSGPANFEDYRKATANIQWLIKQAADRQQTLRAMGNNWSFSKVAMCSGGIINTKNLNFKFKVGPNSVLPQYTATGKSHKDLLFVQGGISILELNQFMETMLQPARCLRASGGSNGQSIAGATSTGTHGGGLRAGAVHDAIVGLHIITGADRHVWLERATSPVAAQPFLDLIGAELIRNDEMFNAAVVSFGSFGVIHGVMLETEPIFLLEERRFEKIPYTTALRQAIDNQDMAALRQLVNAAVAASDAPAKVYMPEETADCQLYHLEIAVNPHKFATGDPEKGIHICTFYKIPFSQGYQPQHNIQESGRTYSNDLMGVVSKALDAFDALGPSASKALIPRIVNGQFENAMRARIEHPMTIGEIFKHTRFRGQIASAAFAVDCSDTFRVVEEIVALNAQTPLAGGIGLRFVKGSKATLGFTKFEKSCVVELDSIDAEITQRFFTKTWERLEAEGIPFTLHWGKINSFLKADRVRRMYGDAQVDSWLACRAALLDSESRKVFSNEFMANCGLLNTEPVPLP